jgi:nucleoside-diphosphate-sugar epimerase
LRSPRKAVVTGGCGFIGSHIIDKLLDQGIETYALDDLSTGMLENVRNHLDNELFHLVQGDISNIFELFAKVRDIDVVFHEAAIASVTRSITEHELVFQSNVSSSIKVLNFCKEFGVKKIIFASSSAVYGETKTKEPNTEDATYNPTSPYGASKISIENYLYAYWKTFGLESVCLRYFNVYGPRQSNNEYSGVITIFVDRILKNLPPIIYGDGLQIRDFVNIEDVVQADMLSMESKDAVGQVFNIGTGVPTTIKELVETAKIILVKKDIEPKFTDPRVGDIRRSLPSISKAKKLLGYNPKVNLQAGIENFINEIKKSDKYLLLPASYKLL